MNELIAYLLGLTFGAVVGTSTHLFWKDNKKEDSVKVEILKKSKRWYWRIVAKNGEVICHSETYSSKAKAKKTVKALLAWAGKE